LNPNGLNREQREIPHCGKTKDNSGFKDAKKRDKNLDKYKLESSLDLQKKKAKE
jgi:hypothetical protein